MEGRRHVRVIIPCRISLEEHVGATRGGTVLLPATEMHVHWHINVWRAIIIHNTAIHRADIQLEMIVELFSTLHILISD